MIEKRVNSDGSVRFYDRKPGSMIQLCRTEPNPTKASLREWGRRAAVSVWEREHNGGWSDPQKPLQDAIREWLVERSDSCTSATVDASQGALRRLVAALGDDCPQIVSGLRPAHLEAWRASRRREVADATILTESRHVQSFLNWCRRREYIRERLDAIPEGEHLDGRPKPQTFIATPRLHEIVESLSGLAQDVVIVLAATGLRRGTLAAMVPAWLDPNEPLIHVPNLTTGRTKRQQRDLPVGPNAWAIIGRHRTDDGPIFRTATGRPLTRQANTWLERWGISPHDLRRWYSETLLELGCPTEYRQALLGHTPSRRDGAYQKPPVAVLRPWAEQVDSLAARRSGGMGS